MREELKQKEFDAVAENIWITCNAMVRCIHHNKLNLFKVFHQSFSFRADDQFKKGVAKTMSTIDAEALIVDVPLQLKRQNLRAWGEYACLGLCWAFFTFLIAFAAPEYFASVKTKLFLLPQWYASIRVTSRLIDLYWINRWKRAINHLERLHDDTYFAPSHHAEYLLWLLLPQQSRDAMLGDLNEGFEKVAERHGLPRAKFWYWCQAFRSTGPLLGRLLEMLIRLALHK